MDPAKFLDWIKLSPKYLLAVFLASAFLSVGPDAWVNALGLVEFRDAYRIWIGVPLLASGALLAAHWLSSSGQFIRKRLTWRRNLKRFHRKLEQLSPSERAVLREYIENQTKTQYFQLEDGVVQGLVASNVLYRSANVGNIITGFAYNIQPWAWDYLNAHSYLLVDLPHEVQDG